MNTIIKTTLLLVAFLVASINANSQSKDTASYPYWIDMMQDPSVNFYSTQNAFEKYWDGRPQQKGNGWKAFKRWEWFMELEVNPDGTYPDRAKMESEYRSFQRQYSNSNANSVFTTQSVSGSWAELGPIALPRNGTGQPNGMGRLNCVGLHPSDTSIILVGASNGGLWRSSDHGQTWTSNSDTLLSMQISNIRYNPKNPNIVYAGTGDRDAGNRSQAGVIKSTDGGVSWKRSNTGMGNLIVGMLAVNPINPDTILAATNRGIYRSLNAGANWTRVSSNTSNYKDIVLMPGNPQIAYATEGGRFYRSSNYGASWSQITSGIPSGTRGVIAVTPDDSLYVYFLLTQGSVFKGMYRSTDAGLNFSTRSTTPNIMDYSTNGSGNGGQAWYDLDVAVDPLNKNIVYGAGINIFKSTDGGATWAINADWVGRAGADPIHADQHALEYSADKKRLYAGCDGGLYYSQNGSNWTDLSSGIAISEVYKLGQARYNSNAVICGYQDNGTAVYYGNNNWITEIGGDGMECIVDPDNNQFMYGALYYGAVRRSRNNGASFGTIAESGANGITESGAWVTPYILHESDPNTMFIGYRNLWRSNNVRNGNGTAGLGWRKLSNNLGGTNSSTLRVLEQSTANNDILYMARADRKLFRTDNVNDTSPSWVDLTANLPQNAIIADIECHPFLDSVVYIIQNRDIYKSTNLGQSWTNISGNLPNITFRCLVYDEYSSEGIYIGGTPGVYYKDSTMTNWVEFATGLPKDVSVTELEIQYDTLRPQLSLLRASTYGRGLWSSDLYDDGTSAPIAGFNLSDESTCVGNNITLENRSAYMPNSFAWTITPNAYTIQSGSLNSANLTIRLDSAVYYSVQFIATNANGSDTAIGMNLIRGIDTSTSVTCVTTTQNMTSRFGIGISKFRIGDFSNSSNVFDGQNSNVDFTCNGVIELEADSLYTLEVSTGALNDEYADVYIDYNGDGDFTDANERISSMARARVNHYDTIRTITNPIFNQYLRLRVVSDFSSINNDPCRSLRYGESEDYLVNFNFSNAELFASVDSLCGLDTILFRADSVVGRIDSIVWDFGVGAIPRSATGAGPHKVVYPKAGTYQASMKVNDLTPKTKSILISYWPSIALVITDSAICETDSFAIQLHDTISSPNAVQYKWYKNASSITPPNDTLIERNAAFLFEQGSYQVIANNNGCRDTSNNIQLIVSPKPVSIASAWTDSAQCLNENEYLFTRSSNVSSGTVSGTWFTGNNARVIGDTLRVRYQGPGSYRVTLIDSTDKACTDSSVFQVEVLNSPSADFSLDSALCFNNHQLSIVDQSNQLAGQQRDWDLGDGTVSSDSIVQHSYSTSGSYQVQLIQSLATGCADTVIKSLMIYDNPVSDFEQNDSIFCLNENELEVADLTTSNDNYTRTWSLGDGNSSSDSSLSHVYVSSGNYQISLVANSIHGCADTSFSSVEILPSPTASFTTQNVKETRFDFTPSDTSLNAYFWDFGDGNSGNLVIETHIYTQNGVYQVLLQVSDSNDCMGSSSQELQIESVGQLEVPGTEFILFPNPSNGEVYLKSSSNVLGEIKVFDARGKLVKSIESNGSEETIKLGVFSAGVYFVEAGSEENNRVKLIIY